MSPLNRIPLSGRGGLAKGTAARPAKQRSGFGLFCPGLQVVLAILHNVLIGQPVRWDACISVAKGCAKRTYKTTLCNLASGSFLWRVFLFCAVGAAL